jgi:ABC-type bacteriocin/lantibiotic exporter with double-glycine peptidase domain
MKIRKKRSVPMIKQTSMMECGTTSLAMIFRYYGLYNIKTLLSDLANVSTQGTNLYQLSELAELFGFETDAYQLESYKNFEELTLPCIAHFEGNHFVVITKVTKEEVFINDPAYGKAKYSHKDFSKKWNGIVLNLRPTKNVFKNKNARELVEEFRSKQKKILKSFYLSILFPFKKILKQILIFSFLLQILALALPIFTQTIIDKVLVYQDKRLLYAIMIGMLAVFICQILFVYVRNVLMSQFKVQLELSFFSKFFQHFIYLTQSFFDMHKREDFINRFQENLKLRKILSPSVLEAMVNFLFAFIYLVVLYLYSPVLALIASFFILVYVILAIRFTPTLQNLENKVFHENLKTMGGFMDSLLGILNVKTLGIEKLRFWSWKSDYQRALNTVLENEMVHIKMISLLKAFYLLSHVFVYWSGAYLAINGTISIGQYVAFITIFSLIMNSMNSVSMLWFMFTELSVTYTRMNDIFLQDPEKYDILKQQTHITNSDIKIEKFTFKYPENPDQKILIDLNLEIKSGEKIGIIGRNGSGKTTLVKLLIKLYDQYEGAIYIGGNELKSIHPHFLRKKLFLFPQEVFLFDGTIKENIKFSNPDATMEDIVKAAKLADIHGFIKDNYLGYNLRVGENGMNLSGGQILKIGFARLFLANPDIIMLDEASSALDVETEKKIMDNIYEHFKDQTILIIAHRLNTLKKTNRILVLDEGKLAEDGSHEELLNSKGLYYQFMQTYLNP